MWSNGTRNNYGSSRSHHADDEPFRSTAQLPRPRLAGQSYDNALAESINGLYKTELIRPRRPWRTIEEVELATAEWVHWFNHRRLYEYCGDIPPVELETAYYAQHRSAAAG
jgi:putative transposase